MKSRRMSLSESFKALEEFMLDLEDVRPVDMPNIEDYGITQVEIDKVNRRKHILATLKEKISLIAYPIALFTTITIGLKYSPNISQLLQVAVGIISVILLTMLIIKLSDVLIKSIAKLYINPDLSDKVDSYLNTLEQYEKYQKKLKSEQYRAKREYWLKLNGNSFEQEIAGLYKKLGFDVTCHGGSGDGGVDIFLVKGRKHIIVQCKAHKKPVGPHIVRDLHGALLNSGAHEAILVSVSGFTIGVETYVKDKPIELVDLDKILIMQDKILNRLST